MEQEKKRVTLSDILNYEADTYLNANDIELIRSTFKDNPRLLRVLRKVLLPSIGDPEMPMEELGSDAWMAMREWDQIPADEAKIMMVSRQDALKFIAGGLIKIKIIANQAVESPEAKKLRMMKDSSK